MKLNRLETHDRLLHFKKDQSASIFQGAEDCLKKNPDSLFFQDRSPYVYLFAHPRTDDDGVTKKMYWQPRLWKPKAQTNSYLFRAQSHSDIIQVCWLLPPQEMWSQYIMGNVTENKDVLWSIDQYCNHRHKLEADEPDDLSDEKGKSIMLEWIANKRFERMMNRSYGNEIKLDFLEASSSSSDLSLSFPSHPSFSQEEP
jgi:hypothetical protein